MSAVELRVCEAPRPRRVPSYIARFETSSSLRSSTSFLMKPQIGETTEWRKSSGGYCPGTSSPGDGGRPAAADGNEG